MIAFKLPALGSDMERGKLLEWRAKPGDRLKRGDVVAVVDTSKAAVEVEIWEEGTMHEWIVKPGETVPIGTVLALLLAPGEAPETAVRPKLEPVRPAVPAPAAAPAAAAPAVVAPPARRRVSPAARKHAEDLGVNLDAVAGTGPEGAVTVEDVERAAKAPPRPLARPPLLEEEGKGVEMRRAIAAAMARSKREIPHYYLSETISLRRAAEWLEAGNARRPITERLLMAVLFIKATALACKAYPDMNGHFRDGRFAPGAAVHAGVAISLRQGGLVAPAIHDAQAQPLPELMKSLADLVKRARAGSLRSSEMSDPTITVTNLGEGGVESVFAIIYPPQVAIVGFGTVVPRTWVEDGAVRIAPTVVASLAADHRVSDGHRGALFLAEIARLLQEPEKL
jgi:pyruvate dehydrogenase E2 component (dihydrolipoamide acetyltransferase)